MRETARLTWIEPGGSVRLSGTHTDAPRASTCFPRLIPASCLIVTCHPLYAPLFQQVVVILCRILAWLKKTFTGVLSRMNWTFPFWKSCLCARWSTWRKRSRIKSCTFCNVMWYLTLLDKSLNFIEDQSIRLHHLGAAWDPISEEVVLEALESILDPRNYPLIVMCNLGRHRTGPSCPSRLIERFKLNEIGTVVGCLRKLQKWSLTAIFEEYRRYAGSKVRVLNEQFIELFDTDLVRLPTNAPPWIK